MVRTNQDNHRRRKHGEAVLLYATGGWIRSSRDVKGDAETAIIDALADIGHVIGPKHLERLAGIAKRHVETERWEARNDRARTA